MIDSDDWKQITVKEARDLEAGYLVWWRPNMFTSSKDYPDFDPAYVVEVK